MENTLGSLVDVEGWPAKGDLSFRATYLIVGNNRGGIRRMKQGPWKIYQEYNVYSLFVCRGETN